MKYIDAEKLKAEIERQRVLFEYNGKTPDERTWRCLGELISFIDSLQQEQPEQKKKCNDCPHCIDRKDQYGWHFKGCFGGPYKGKFIAEIDKCPLEHEQPEMDLERDAVQFCFDKGLNVTPYQAKTIACHFYELGLNAKKIE